MYICWRSGVTALNLYYHSTVPCPCKGGINASTIWHLYRYISVICSLAALVTYPIALHSTFNNNNNYYY